MYLRLKCFIFLTFFVLNNNADRNVLNIRTMQPVCTIPNDDQPGVCLAMNDCQAFVQLKNTTINLNFLKSLECNVEMGLAQQNDDADSEVAAAYAPLVCCPENGRIYLQPVVPLTKIKELKNAIEKSIEQIAKNKTATTIMSNKTIAAFNLTQDCGREFMKRIYGGEVTELNEYPWLALLIYNTNEYGCSGTLIDARHVLTAAHCVKGAGERRRKGLKLIRLGEFNVMTEPDCIEQATFRKCANAALDVAFEEIFVHPDYAEEFIYSWHDIAIIRLRRAVPFTHSIMPICLPSKLQTLPFEAGQMFYVSGWGRTDFFDKLRADIRSPIKLKLRIPYMPHEECSQLLGKRFMTLSPKQICAGGEHGRDTCGGDSGGPLMYFDRLQARWTIYGVISYGHKECGRAGFPTVFSNVLEYSEWISEVLSLPKCDSH